MLSFSFFVQEETKSYDDLTVIVDTISNSLWSQLGYVLTNQLQSYLPFKDNEAKASNATTTNHCCPKLETRNEFQREQHTFLNH